MGRACSAICSGCGTRATVLVSQGRAGISSWSGPISEDGGSDGADVVDLEAASWPPCPVCLEHRLRRDPNSTDLLFTDGESPPGLSPPVDARRRAGDSD